MGPRLPDEPKRPTKISGRGPLSYRRVPDELLAPGKTGLRYNASAIRHNGEILLCHRTDPGGSRLHLTRCHDDLTPKAPSVTLNLDHHRCRGGQEDPRLFHYRGKVHLSFTGVETHLHTSVLFCAINDDLTAGPVMYPEYAHRTLPMEKNWVFFEGDDGDLYCVYNIHPKHMVFRVPYVNNGRIRDVYQTSTEGRWSGGHYRGGASPVRIGNEFVHFFHGMIRHKRGLYSIGAYSFQTKPPFRITRLTPHPLVWSDHATQPATNPHYDDVIYPGGVLIESDKLRIVSGEHDRNIAEHVFDLPNVMGAMERMVAATLCVDRGRSLHPPEVPNNGKAYVRCEGKESPHYGKPVCQCNECGPQCPAYDPDADPTDTPEIDDGLTAELRHQIVAVTRPEDAADGAGLPGWCSTGKAKAMASLILQYRPKVIVEIGVFGGRSLIPMAMACRQVESGHVFGIDPYDNDAAAVGLPPKDAEWWSGVDIRGIRHVAEQSVKMLGLSAWCSLIADKSENVAWTFDRIDMLHIDGNHGEEPALKDVALYLPLVRPGGWVWMDDTDNPTVQRALAEVERQCELVKTYPAYSGIAEHRLYRVRQHG